MGLRFQHNFGTSHLLPPVVKSPKNSPVVKSQRGKSFASYDITQNHHQSCTADTFAQPEKKNSLGDSSHLSAHLFILTVTTRDQEKISQNGFLAPGSRICGEVLVI